MSWGVWCARAGGQLPPASAWLKEGGEEWTAETEAEATVKAQETSLAAYETFTMAERSNPLTYRVRSYVGRAARREIFKNLRDDRRQTDG